MLEEDSCKDMYFLWHLMIAKEHQGKGYGQQAIEAITQYLRRRMEAAQLSPAGSQDPMGRKGFISAWGFSPMASCWMK
jgi:GNAT superfamily N-acetyltransferase